MDIITNIYEKLQRCKADLQAANLKKTGKNTFAKYDYWELSDFMPTVVSLFANAGLCSYFSFSSEYATLTIVNIERTEETVVLKSPMAAADLKGCHAIQNVGAVETYQRRYLWMMALDISEPDALDATQQKEAAAKKAAGAPPPPEEKEYRCQQCGKPFTAFSHNGKSYTAAQAFHMSETKYGGKALCYACGKKAKEG